MSSRTAGSRQVTRDGGSRSDGAPTGRRIRLAVLVLCTWLGPASTAAQQPPVDSTFTLTTSKLPSTSPELIQHQGGIIRDRNITLTKAHNPIRITKDIIIKRDAKLTIEAGAELFFERSRGIVVHGTLEILGNFNDKVKLNLLRNGRPSCPAIGCNRPLRQVGQDSGRSEAAAGQSPQSQLNFIYKLDQTAINFHRSQQVNASNQQVRLVDGDLPSEGRVQIKLGDRWHSLCTNSKNLTSVDIKVICRQAGYQDGHWYKWFPRRNDTSTLHQLMSESFHCTGAETSLSLCRRWTRVRTGGGICDKHSDLGVRCTKTMIFNQDPDSTLAPSSSHEFWRGIEFVQSDSSFEYVLEGQMKQRVSKSILRHVSISDAGLNEVNNATAAVRVTGQPPRISDLEVKDSVYGIMIEDVDDPVRMSNVRLVNNLGFPLFINTSWGKISLDNLQVEHNGGDGIRIARHERVIVGSHDFCKFANLGQSQSFPVVLSHEQTFLTSGRECCQEFLSSNQLTVHFPVLRSTPNNLLPDSDTNRRISFPKDISLGRDANLVIYDDYRDEFPFRLRVANSTRAQSIVSKSGRLKICYEPASYRTVLFTIEVVANEDDEWSGIANDVEISNSLINKNQGRGIWVENPRSGIKITNTTVTNNNYLSGLHFENGTGQVIIQGSKISSNYGHGVLINLAGGYYHIDNSTISDNTLKGLSVDYDKRPELVPFNHTVHVGYTLLARNGENGIFIGNVCRSDAFWNVSMNSFIKNGEDAIAFRSCLPTADIGGKFNQLTSRLNLTDPDLAFRQNYQELHVTHNVFLANLRRAVNLAPVYYLKSFIRHNMFREHPLAVINVNSRPTSENSLELVDLLAPVNIRIASNRFLSNRGRYVANVGLQEDNPKHQLVFTKNVVENNVITEPYAELKPRSRVCAVVVVSSSNVRVTRNRFNNPESAFEMGSHLEAHDKVINATTNFWGHNLDAASIYRRIFDRKNRYNLAQVEFLQYLMSQEDLEFASDLSFERERDKISSYRNGTRLGGEVKGYEELPPDTYIVQDDIYIRPGGHLILRPGTVFRFQDGVGVLVQGRLDALGQAHSQIVFTSAMSTSRLPQRTQFTTTPAPVANPWISHHTGEGQQVATANNGETEETRPSGSSSLWPFAANSSSWLSPEAATSGRRVIKKRQTAIGSGQNARLSHTTMGRLEVQIDGVWGPVCDYNFDIDDAAVVCQQLGMILNKDDWLLEKYQYAANDQLQMSLMSNNVLMTNLRCDPTLDTDITTCKAEVSSRGDFDGMCNSEVGIRCFPPSWSGVRLGMGAETSTLEHVTIQRAGMFDYATYALRPALQIDFNRHLISSIVVKSNSDSGLGIMWNDVIGRHFHELTISDSKFHNNERHGISLRSRGMTITSCSVSNNRQNGIDYNPSFSQAELDELLSWLPTPKNSDNIEKLSFPLLENRRARHFAVPSSEESFKFFILQRNPPAEITESFTIGTDLGHMLSIHLINPIHPDSTEQLNMSIGANPDSPIWDLRTNATSFPMISPGYKFHFNYSTGKRPRGNVVLYIRSRYNNRDLKLLTKFIPAHLVASKFEQTAVNINSKLINSLVISNSNITKNGIGIKLRNPDFPYGHLGSFNRRYANESTNITDNIFDSNYYSSIFVGVDDYVLEPKIDFANRSIASSEIFYNIVNNRLRRNKDCVRQFGRDIRYSHNVFHWHIADNVFESNRGGAVNVLLPYFWRYDTNLSHTIDMNNNSFLRNSNFELTIDGHYVAVNLTRNTFKDNKCRDKLISFSGMEKRMLIKYNVIEQNFCSRLLDFNIQSHADKMGFVQAQLEFNSIRYNRKSVTNSSSAAGSNFKYPKLLSKLHPQASDYALSLYGLQSLNVTRNLFSNQDLRFELVVAIIMDSDERTVNAAENFWGSVLPSEINERIFDFDDWNNYAVAEISPYLTLDSFSAATMIIAEPREFYQGALGKISSFGSRPLGGRLTKSTTLPYRREPYIVESDFTVMPNVQLIIEKGVTLEFMPNVGILVLGDMVAAGTRDRPIQMRPLLSAADILPIHSYLFPGKQEPYFLQSKVHYSQAYEHNYAFRQHQSAYPIDLGSIRLCKNEICNDGQHIYENNVEDPNLRREVLESVNNTWKMDGFIEVFNMTTLQWVPICDPLFTEHTARVACRQLGYTHLSLFKRGRRYTIEPEQITSVKHWPESVQCEGSESSLASCQLLAPGYTNHSTACVREGNQFVYVFCSDFPESSSSISPQVRGPSNELGHHWGGIRFSCPPLITNTNIYDDRETHNMILQANNITRSRLQYITIDRAGMLHGKKAPAVQMLQCNVQLEYVAITNSAHHGLETITSYGFQHFHQMRLRNNLGVGLNYFSLTGSSSASRLVPYLPLKHLDISTDIFGLVDICGANKEIQIEERMLLFYRYSSQAVDCVKIITSKLSVKHLGVRMLQFDLFNSTAYTTKPDYVKIYDGNIFDRDSRILVEMGVTERHRLERPELKFYQSSDSSMTIRVHASGSRPVFGFIAEVVTTPVTYNIQRDTYNNITFSEMTNNKLGAIAVFSAGESSPNLIVKNNRLETNGLHLFGNFTSCLSSIYMELQNCQRLKIANNLIKNNQGGIMIKSYSHTAVSALEAVIENNVIEGNQNTNVLALLGPRTDPYQTVRVHKNFITRNYAPYLSNVVLSRIVSNFSGNIMSGNIGKHQIEVVGFDKLPLSYQTFWNNWIYNNSATYERDRSTIFGNSAGQQYFHNYLVNPDNHFEMSTMNWSRYDVKIFHVPRDDEIIHLTSGDGSTKDVFRKTADAIPITIIDTRKVDLYQASINARQNWWGFNTSSAIRGRIRDRSQHEELIKVDFSPYLENNDTVLSGICAGGWHKVGNACLLYISSRMTYAEARDFCDRERATLPLLEGNHYEFTDFVLSQEPDYEPIVDRVWIRSFEVSRDACPALNHYRTRNFDCQEKNPFLCEKDPQVVVSLWHWHWRNQAEGIIALIFSLVTTVLTLTCILCWAYKSRQRYKEKLERKSSIYASMRSNRGGYASNNSLNEFAYLHRQIYPPDKSSITDLSLSTQLTPTSGLDFGVIQQKMRPDSTYVTQGKANKVRQARDLITTDPMPNYSAQKSRSQSSSRSSSQHTAFEPQPSLNPTYVSPSPRPSGKSTKQSPAPSYRESQRRSTSLNNVVATVGGSRTPSYTGSYNSDILSANILVGPTLSMNYNPSYSQPNNMSDFGHTRPSDYHHQLQQPIQTNYDYPKQTQRQPTTYASYGGNYSDYTSNQPTYMNHTSLTFRPQDRYQATRNDSNIKTTDESESSAPTYYSNQLEAYEESSHSYLENYNSAYIKTLSQLKNDQTSYIITERSSMTDLVMNSSSQLTHTSSSNNTTADSNNLPPFPQQQNDLPSPKQLATDQYYQYEHIKPPPQYTSDTGLNTAPTNQGHFPTSISPQYNTTRGEPLGSNRYLVETSFDDIEPSVIQTAPLEGPQVELYMAQPVGIRPEMQRAQQEYHHHTQSQPQLNQPTQPQQTSMFGSSQRLSPISSSSYAPTYADSKLGSRVYLETSFE